jgi:hypothetical protein
MKQENIKYVNVYFISSLCLWNLYHDSAKIGLKGDYQKFPQVCFDIGIWWYKDVRTQFMYHSLKIFGLQVRIINILIVLTKVRRYKLK